MERIIHNQEIPGYNPEALWQTAENSMPGVKVWNKKNLSPNLNMTIVLCPLYANGTLDSSMLVSNLDEIEDSRVAGKYLAYLNVVGRMTRYLISVGGTPKITAIFANKGVLHGGKVSEAEYEYLYHHSKLYKDSLGDFCTNMGIGLNYLDYDDLEVEFPIFVDMNARSPVQRDHDKRDEWCLIDAFNENLDLPHKIVNNNKMRHVIKGVMRMDGIGVDEAYWLAAGYLAADHKIADVVGKNGVYIVAERFGALFRLSKLTPDLYQKTRIQINA